MKIILNGEKYSTLNRHTVESLLTELEIDKKKVAVERNLELVHRANYSDTTIFEGDKLEIVHFIGGGNNHDNKLILNKDVFQVAIFQELYLQIFHKITLIIMSLWRDIIKQSLFCLNHLCFQNIIWKGFRKNQQIQYFLPQNLFHN